MTKGKPKQREHRGRLKAWKEAGCWQEDKQRDANSKLLVGHVNHRYGAQAQQALQLKRLDSLHAAALMGGLAAWDTLLGFPGAPSVPVARSIYTATPSSVPLLPGASYRRPFIITKETRPKLPAPHG